MNQKLVLAVFTIFFKIALGEHNPKIVTAGNLEESRVTLTTETQNETVVATFHQTNNPYGITCKYDLNLDWILKNDTLRTICCDEVYDIFRIYWNHSTIKLADLLRALKTWQCPKFEEECTMRYFGFSKFTNLVYDRFCDPNKFVSECKEDIKELIKQDSVLYSNLINESEGSGMTPHNNQNDLTNYTTFTTPSVYDNAWINLVHSDHLADNLRMVDQMKPCVQAALVNVQEISAGKYYEIKQSELAFCDISWCAFRADTFEMETVTDSLCMPSKCAINMYIMMVAGGLLGFIIVLANGTVLLVFGMNRRLMNSQGIYKMSLAAADLLCGLFVFPVIICTMRRGFLSQYEVIESEVVEYSYGSGRNGTRLTIDNYNQKFFKFGGVFTALSLFVSMYTLVIASFDRFLVVHRPLEYNQFRARSIAKKCVAVLWVIGVIYSILPLFVDDLYYMRVASILVSLGGGEVALVLYIITFAIPLFLVWSLNIATFTYSRRNAQVRPKIRFSETTVLSVNLEAQLAKTLSIMVGVFSLCIVPVATVLVSELFITGIHYDVPTEFHMPTAVLVLSLEAVSAFILMSNSLWNFFIYNVRSMEFRACFLSLSGSMKSACCRALVSRHERGSAYSHNVSSTNMNGNNTKKNLTMSTRVRTLQHSGHHAS
ncbi:uncharacterized protein LOC120330705 [Styela clava]